MVQLLKQDVLFYDYTRKKYARLRASTRTRTHTYVDMQDRTEQLYEKTISVLCRDLQTTRSHECHGREDMHMLRK
jgi:hypothetical protein